MDQLPLQMLLKFPLILIVSYPSLDFFSLSASISYGLSSGMTQLLCLRGSKPLVTMTFSVSIVSLCLWDTWHKKLKVSKQNLYRGIDSQGRNGKSITVYSSEGEMLRMVERP